MKKIALMKNYWPLVTSAMILMLPFPIFAVDQVIREGDVVTTSDHYNATVLQVFPDGLVDVVIGSDKYQYSVTQLFKPIRCLERICVGDDVTTSDHYNATVLQVFPDGLVRVVIGSGTYQYSIAQLFKPIECLERICVGDVVTTNDHYNAIVKQVFPDGLVHVVIGPQWYAYYIKSLYVKPNRRR